MAALAVLVDQVRPPQQTQVLRDSRPRDGKCLRDLPGRLASAAQQIEHRPPRRVGQRAESRFGGICNRLVPHDA